MIYAPILVGSIFAYLLIAIYNTLTKEKTMVEEGGEPLPTSSYMFLVLKYVLWGLVTNYTVRFLPQSWTSAEGMKMFLMVSLVTVVTYLIATVIEVLFRTVLVYVAFRKESARLKREE